MAILCASKIIFQIILKSWGAFPLSLECLCACDSDLATRCTTYVSEVSDRISLDSTRASQQPLNSVASHMQKRRASYNLMMLLGFYYTIDKLFRAKALGLWGKGPRPRGKGLLRKKKLDISNWPSCQRLFHMNAVNRIQWIQRQRCSLQLPTDYNSNIYSGR